MFSAREVNTSGVHAGLLADAAGGVYICRRWRNRRAYLEANVRPGDTVLLIGAGNVNTVWDIIKKRQKRKNVGIIPRRVYSVKSAQAHAREYRNVWLNGERAAKTAG